MPLFETTPIDKPQISKLVLEHWGLELGACIKESQNHTFLATRDEVKYIVRVTPDPAKKRRASMELELALLAYLRKHGLSVAAAVPASNQSLMLCDGDLCISVFEYASGEAVLYTDWRWLEENYARGVGRWFGKFHRLSQQFRVEHPQLYAQGRRWTELHDCLLSTYPVDERDLATVDDPNQFGLIHGDVNPSNYFWQPELETPFMFDWDQSQHAWFLYDLAQPLWGVYVTQERGAPDYSVVPQANLVKYRTALLEGYQEEGFEVDLEALDRMVAIRRQLYKSFCNRALLELDPTSFMGKFCKGMADWLGPE